MKTKAPTEPWRSKATQNPGEQNLPDPIDKTKSPKSLSALSLGRLHASPAQINSITYPEPGGSKIDTEENFQKFQRLYLEILKEKYPLDYQARLIAAKDFVKKLYAITVTHETNIEAILNSKAILPLIQRPKESRKANGVLPWDEPLMAEHYIFGTFGKPQERGQKDHRVAFLVDPMKHLQFFTMQDCLGPGHPPEIDWSILEEQKMHPNHLLDHFALMVAIAYEKPEDFLHDHEARIPSLYSQSNRFARVECELRMRKIKTEDILGIVVENPNTKDKLLNLGYPEKKIFTTSGDDWLAEVATIGYNLKG